MDERWLRDEIKSMSEAIHRMDKTLILFVERSDVMSNKIEDLETRLSNLEKLLKPPRIRNYIKNNLRTSLYITIITIFLLYGIAEYLIRLDPPEKPPFFIQLLKDIR